jgi:hypothetical protein
VRLKFEDVKSVPKKRKPKVDKKKKKVVDKDGSDFDSEKEYGSEGGNDEEGSFEMDDGKTPLKEEDANEEEDAEMSSDLDDEEGEEEMSEVESEEEEDKVVPLE